MPLPLPKKQLTEKYVEIEKDEDDCYIKYEVELSTYRGKAEVEIDETTEKSS